MITYYIVYFLIGIVGVITSPLLLAPDVTLPATIATSLAAVAGWLGLLIAIIPYTLTAIFAALVVIVGVETHLFSYKVVRWIYSKIPGVN